MAGKKVLWVLLLLVLTSGMTWVENPTTAAAPPQEQPGSSIGVIGFVGYVVDDVGVGSPAANADIRKNDIIVYLGGRLVRSAETITEVMALTPPGTDLEVKFVRYDPEVKKFRAYAVHLVTVTPNPPGTTKWLYREPQQ